jgi:excinuclease ABC subunit C
VYINSLINKKSFLDDIKGIGPKTKSRLLKKFKSIKLIKTATVDELMTIAGINEKIAKNITSYKN